MRFTVVLTMTAGLTGMTATVTAQGEDAERAVRPGHCESGRGWLRISVGER
jgi:hypothetical protein